MSTGLNEFLLDHGVGNEVAPLDDFLSSYLTHDDTGNTTAVIVALPSDIDPIRLVGSEDKHATLLYFGETATLPEDAKSEIIEVLTLAASMFSPFTERIVDFFRLGSDIPPALVAMLSSRTLPGLRNTMLIVPEFNEYLGNVTQYPSYTPHVTLDYPDYQAEVALRQKASDLGAIRFDRLALWWNDERLEFPLTYTGMDVSPEASHSTDLLVDFIMHHGVKGQKWGVRRANTNGGTFVKAKRRTAPILGDQGDVKGVSNKVRSAASLSLGVRAATEGSTIAAAHIAGYALSLGTLGAGAALALPAGLATKAVFSPLSTAYHTSKGDIRRGVTALNTKYSKPGHDLKTNKKLQSSYNKDYEKVVNDSLNKSKSGLTHPFRKIAEKRAGKTDNNKYVVKFNMNSSSTKKPTLRIEGPNHKLFTTVKLGTFKHDDMGDDVGLITEYAVVITRGSDGYISDFSIPALDKLDDVLANDEMSHAAEFENFLAHHGIKGQKWGVRRSSSELSGGDGSSSSGGSRKERKAAAKIEKHDVKLMSKMKAGSVVTIQNEAGSFKTMVKKKDGSWEETHLSADADRFLKARTKEGHELSNAELKDAINRQNQIDKYNELFNSDTREKEIGIKIKQLEFEKAQLDYSSSLAKAKRENKKPGVHDKLNSFLAASEKTFSHYNAINKASGGLIGNTLFETAGLTGTGKHMKAGKHRA